MFYIYPYLSWLTLPPFIFQADIYIYLFLHVVMRADAFIKYIFSTTELTVYLYEKKKKFQRYEKKGVISVNPYIFEKV